MSFSDNPSNSVNSKVGSFVGGTGNGFNGAKEVVKVSKKKNHI